MNLTGAPSRVEAKAYAPATALSVWCDRLIEAGWLAAVVVAPLFFNIYSSRVFEPDKLTTVRSIALAMCALWMVKFVEEWRNPNRERRVTWRTPMVLPTLILVVVYMLSTAMSVAPRTSLLGSYQRLQGSYTTFAYIVIFFMILQGLRTRVQLDRLINIIILNSLPIALYGMLQRAQLDPLPWGGDVTERVAGNMGNAIFIAAYLVMTFFLALGRVAEIAAAVARSPRARLSELTLLIGYGLISLVTAIVVLILAGSRGPQLGFLFGVFFIALLLVQLIRRRKARLTLTIAMIGVAFAGLAFILLLNIKSISALDPIRSLPLLNRLSTVVQVSEGTNKVRFLIWQGDVEMMSPHAPTENPDGSLDPFNAIRPLVGYGPESMYVAYNRFYPPALTTVEARNASPDRSHNETWDAIVITGGVGLIAYLLLFGSVFYCAFKWIGLVASKRERYLFIGLWTGGALLGGLFAVAVDPPLLGVSVAAGASIGLTVYLVVSAILNATREDEATAHTGLQLRDQILIIAIISAIAAHFIEIHLGIAIASTRSHFWAFAAMLVVIGMGFLQDTRAATLTDAVAAEPKPIEPPKDAGRKPAPAGGSAGQRKQRAQAQANSAAKPKAAPAGPAGVPTWFSEIAGNGLMLGMVLGVMAFCFITNSDRLTTAGFVFGNALTVLRGHTSLGVALIFLVTWLLGSAVLVADAQRNERLGLNADGRRVGAALALCLSVALVVWLVYGTFIAGRLVDLVVARTGGIDDILAIADNLGSFPAYLYLLVGLTMIVFAAIVRKDTGLKPREPGSVGGFATLIFIVPYALYTMSTSNLQPIAADIVYKQANPWDGQGNAILQQGTSVQGWDVAIEHYRKAIQLAPNEDFYYLWLGRALLEKAKGTPNTQAAKQWPDQVPFTDVIANDSPRWNRKSFPLPSATLSREDLLTAARTILDEARRINPLNTDHSANLARMWRQSADITQDPNLKRQRYENSSREYGIATSLSPNNSQLWNEWGSLYLYSLGDAAKAREKLDHSVEIDPFFEQTYLLRGDFLMQDANRLEQQRQQIGRDITSAVSDTAKLAALQAQQQSADAAYKAALRAAEIEFTRAISVNPQSAQAYNVLTYINQQLGDLPDAIRTAEGQAEKFPQDWNVFKNLMLLYNEAKLVDKARAAGERAIQLAPKEQQAALQNFLNGLPKQ